MLAHETAPHVHTTYFDYSGANKSGMKGPAVSVIAAAIFVSARGVPPLQNAQDTSLSAQGTRAILVNSSCFTLLGAVRMRIRGCPPFDQAKANSGTNSAMKLTVDGSLS